jgi:hypothetical protein
VLDGLPNWWLAMWAWIFIAGAIATPFLRRVFRDRD